MYTPDSAFWLCSVPLDLSSANQLTFKNKEEQFNYFRRNCSFSSDQLRGYVYVRKDNAMLIPGVYDNFVNVNYIVYRNTHFSNKYFYAYITKVEYENEKSTRIYLKTDVFQTWQFDITFHKSFIARQHYKEDQVNTLPDSPDAGVLVSKKSTQYLLNGATIAFCQCDMENADTSNSDTTGCRIGNAYYPNVVYFFNDVSAMNNKILEWANKGFGDRILNVVYLPFVHELTYERNNDGSCKYIDAENNHDEITLDISDWLSGKHKKQLSYPYSVIRVVDCITGDSKLYNPDKFDSTTITFRIEGTISDTPSYRIIPKNYEGTNLSYEKALTVNTSAYIPMANNLYAKYMMQNQNSIATNMVMASLKIPEAFTSAGLGGAGVVNTAEGVTGVPMTGSKAIGIGHSLIGAIEHISSLVAKQDDAKTLGGQTTKLSDGYFQRRNYDAEIRVELLSLDDSHQAMCENYWDMYGYPVNSMAEPNIDGNDYNYIKMVNGNITGDIAQEDLKEIQDIFNAGVTLWHDPSKFLEY